MSERVITSLAILKVNWDQRGSSYTDNFVPFVAECLRQAPQAEVSLPELQTAITETFDLTIPQGALKTILRRAAKRGYVKRTRGIYRRNDVELAALGLASIRDDVLRQHEALVSKLIEFCKERYKVCWSREQAEAALLSYLQERSAHVLSAAVDGQPILRRPGHVEHADFLVNAFIAHLYEADPHGFEFLETIVKGSMLANVLVFPSLGGVAHRFEHVEVYFDTGFLLRALGLGGDAMMAACTELIDLLYELNADLRCFEHTLEEMRHILDVAANALLRRNTLSHPHGEALVHFLESGWRSSDVELLIARLEEELKGIRVEVRATPPLSKSLGVDELKLQSTLQQEVGYLFEKALQHDLDCLTAIYRLRRGSMPWRLEACRAIFVSTNSALAKASGLFFREEYEDVRIPHCMPDHAFTTLVWLKKPLRAPDLPRKRIVADCYAAMNPSDSLWKLYLEEMDRLRDKGGISEKDYDLLLSSTEAKKALMEVTLGDPLAFTDGTIEQVRERARKAVTAETQAALDTERAKRLEAEDRAATAEAGGKARRQAQLKHFQNLGAKVGRWFSRVLLSVGTLLLVFGVYLTFPRPFPDNLAALWRLAPPVVILVLCVFAFLTIANIGFGASLLSLVRQLEISVSRLIERTLIRIAKP